MPLLSEAFFDLWIVVSWLLAAIRLPAVRMLTARYSNGAMNSECLHAEYSAHWLDWCGWCGVCGFFFLFCCVAECTAASEACRCGGIRQKAIRNGDWSILITFFFLSLIFSVHNYVLSRKKNSKLMAPAACGRQKAILARWISTETQ